MIPWYFPPSHQESVADAVNQASCQFQMRPATSADLIGVAQIIAESFHSQNGIWAWTFPLIRLGIYEDLKHRFALPAPHQVCLVAVDTTSHEGDNLVGTVELGVRFSDTWTQGGKTFPYLSNLAVHPKYRRQGAASELLAACEKVALSWGFHDLYLHVLEDNHQARELYFKLGYQVHFVESHWNIFLLKRSRQIFLHKRIRCD
ncbi:GNAT family N-acetyltransferase [Aetokthonos hydrillicola]|uniref:GNAT family N-acetyltransferase n=1 Tax=Aetokthonos hydrillicola TaxID=1550245 RepID=UPI001ABA9FDC|nr:GNAT family N-acetyltransferase [Aetokthonos hydrillicola CCALA 1050]MBW4586826.1 GNAT family N-acetyltransferase [Aetokthonos hydrillicola CCALA 1050]